MEKNKEKYIPKLQNHSATGNIRNMHSSNNYFNVPLALNSSRDESIQDCTYMYVT